MTLLVGGVLAGCASDPGTAGSTDVGSAPASSTVGVAAQREAYTTDQRSPVIHDTETNTFVTQGHRLFAATDQWEYPGPHAYGQVLVKDQATGPWRVFEQTQGLRVQALDSFSVFADQGVGQGRSLLVTQPVLHGRSELQWALDGAQGFAPSDSYGLSSAGDDAPGVPAQKVTGFADCGGALYATINTNLYRRNDGTLPSGVARWVLVYKAPPVGAHNSGLRGISCTSDGGSPSLLLSTEGNGNVYRFDHLPSGQIDAPGSAATALAPNLEFSPIAAIRQMLSKNGTTVPASGTGSIGYVIAAYNNGDFQSVNLDGRTRQIFGFEWGYIGSCPSTRTCGPVAFGAVHFDAAACFAIRTPSASSQNYEIHCLTGPDFKLSGRVGHPIQAGEAFVSIRTIVPSPFEDGRLYYGGYDCNFHPADGTAWVATSALRAIHIDDIAKERT